MPAPIDIGAMVREQRARYNIAPIQPVLAVHADQGAIAAAERRWGIGLPVGKARQLINVRADTALKGGLFTAPAARRRWRRATVGAAEIGLETSDMVHLPRGACRSRGRVSDVHRDW